MTLALIALYLALVLAVGFFAQRAFRGTGEDFFLATRTIGPFVLLMTLFGTHMTAFSLLGASGEAYHRGTGVFSLMASSSALVVPVVFYYLAPRVWEIGRRNGYRTQVDLFRDRWGSEALALVLFLALVGLLIPYLLIGVMGGGITLHQITGGQVPQWVGSLVLCGVVFAYVTGGGARATAWANTFQTLVFMGLGALTFVVILRSVGGLEQALSQVAPELLHHGDRIPAAKLVSYTLIPLSVGMFPHIFLHWLTAQSSRTFRLAVVAYPLCLVVVWIPSVLLGVLGSADVPGLEGPASGGVLIRMIDLHAPEALAGLLGAGVLAAVMSSLDSQVLALSTLFTRGLVRLPALRRLGWDERREVLAGRLFVGLILGGTFLLSLVTERSIFRLGVWSFTGFAALLPLGVAALFWRRATLAGAWASTLTAVGLWLVFFVRAGQDPDYTVAGSGVMPVAVILAASALALVAVSLATRAPDAERLARFFPETSSSPGPTGEEAA